MLITKQCIIAYHFIACNCTLCCSGLRSRVLSAPGQIQIQMVVSFWTITFVIDLRGRRWKGIGESESTEYISEPAWKNAFTRWGFVYHWKRPEFTTPKCVVLLYCAPRKASTERNGDWKLSFEAFRIYRGLSTETIARILWANQKT